MIYNLIKTSPLFFTGRKLRLPGIEIEAIACVLQILLYGADTWTLLADDTRRLQSFHFMPTPDTGCEVAGPCQEHRHSRQDLLLNVQWKP